MDKIFTIKKHASSDVTFEAFCKQKYGNQTMNCLVFQVHEDDLDSIIDKEKYNRLEEGEEIEFRLVEVR